MRNVFTDNQTKYYLLDNRLFFKINKVFFKLMLSNQSIIHNKILAVSKPL